MNEHSRMDFAYRQLENDLIYISKSIINALQSGECTLEVSSDESTPNSRWHEIQANMEKSFIEIAVYFSWPNDGYSIRIWDKNTPPSERDQNLWSKASRNKTSCPGSLAWDYSDEDRSDEGITDFDSGLQDLIYKYFIKIEDVYFSVGSVSSTVKNLL